MEMEFPEADELEWLEQANSILDDDDESYLEEEEQQHEPQTEPHNLNPPPPPSIQQPVEILGGRKRGRDGEDEQLVSSSKRSESGVGIGGGEEEVLVGLERRSVNVVVEEEEEVLLSRYEWEIDGDCMPVTAPCGERVYTKVGKVKEKVNRRKVINVAARSGGLLSEPVNTLLQRAEQDAFMKALQASSEVPEYEVLPEASVPNEQLWVDKYAPKSFTELLSDEHTNREVLLWLKQWDSSVFGCQIRSTTEEVLSALRRYSSVSYHNKHSDTSFARKGRGYGSSAYSNGFSTQSDHGSVGPKTTVVLQDRKSLGVSSPEKKVLLLCGPPGLGKTTLAHVAALHCGYRVVEINASDDRSSSSIERKILDAVQMNSVMADAKPKCLIIDEIDGALGDGKGAVEIILNMLAAGKKSEAGGTSTNEQFSEKKSSRKGRKVASITRPVICICNDLYAPALRPLLQVAKVHTFTQPTVNRVVSRLKYICNKEGMRANSIALASLAEFTECDIRSCLNTLQFLQKNKEPLNALDISSQVVGRKDTTRNVFDIWKEIFQKRKTKSTRKCETRETYVYDSPDSLYFLVSNRGDYELIYDGVHENILRLHYHDPLMQKTVQCLDTLGVFDFIHRSIMQSQNMPLYAHLPPMAITIHHLVAQVEKPVLEWPRSSQRCRSKTTTNREVLRSWSSRISPYISRHLSFKSAIEDTLSFFLHILSPPTLRPVAIQLLSDREKTDLAQLVSTMVAYCVSYKSTKSDSLMNNSSNKGAIDTFSLSFDPPIEALTIFEGYMPTRIELSLAMKQVLLHEVEKKKILHGNKDKVLEHLEQKSKTNCVNIADATTCAKYSVDEARKDQPVMHTGCNSSLDRLTKGSSKGPAVEPNLKSTGSVKKHVNGSFNFFDRFKKLGGKDAQSAGNHQKATTLERDSRPLLFKFNEGFTNAVRRPVRMHEFLL
ncbi:hypothetical protein Drorol1_Dr00012963 [Drosera rotundifolia]